MHDCDGICGICDKNWRVEYDRLVGEIEKLAKSFDNGVKAHGKCCPECDKRCCYQGAAIATRALLLAKGVNDGS